VTNNVNTSLIDLILYSITLALLFITWFLDYKNNGFSWKY
jgi:hypothetical protein